MKSSPSETTSQTFLFGSIPPRLWSMVRSSLHCLADHQVPGVRLLLPVIMVLEQAGLMPTPFGPMTRHDARAAGVKADGRG